MSLNIFIPASSYNIQTRIYKDTFKPYVWWAVQRGEDYKRCFIKDNTVVEVSPSALLLLPCITLQISHWAEENGIDLANLTEEDKTLIIMKWG